MTPVEKHPQMPTWTTAVPAACLLALVPLTGCRDAASDPMALVVTEETRGALSLDAEIPSVTSVAERVREATDSISDERLHGWSGQWQASWLADDGQGRQARTRVYDDAAAPLAGALGPHGVRRTVRTVAAVMASAAGADLSRLPEAYRRRVEEARSLTERAERSLEAGRSVDALRSALEAGDRLRDISPRRVAVGLLARAEEARRRIPEISTYSNQEKERIARLVRNARYALEAGDYTLAIHRAYYACRLLGVELL